NCEDSVNARPDGVYGNSPSAIWTRRSSLLMLIRSASNPRLKELRAASRDGRSDVQGRVRIEGYKLILEAIRSHVPVEEVYVSESCRRDPDIENLLHQIPGTPEIVEISDRLFP